MPRGVTSRRALVLAVAMLSLSAATLRGEGPWVDQRMAGPFIVRSQFALDEYQELFADLEQIQQDLQRSLAVRRPRAPIAMFLFADKESYRAFIKRHYPGAPQRPALYVKTGESAAVLAYRTENLAVDVRHESTHALLHADLPVVPLWLDEGLAEYFELPAGQRAAGNPYLNSARWTSQLGMSPTLATLEKTPSLDAMGRTQYRYAWSWVHFMLHGPREAHSELVGYLADLRRHAPPGRLSERLQRRLPNLQRRHVEHFRTWGKGE